MLAARSASGTRGRRRVSATQIQYRLLGPFEVRVNDAVVDVGPVKHRVLLAALLLAEGKPVRFGNLAQLMWGEVQPDNPRRAVQLYVVRLRRVFSEITRDQIIATADDGYRMNTRPEQVDITRFQRRLGLAGSMVANGTFEERVTALRAALAEWRGEPLSGLSSALLQHPAVDRLREQWLQTNEQLFAIELERGRHAEVVEDLLTLTAQNPKREPLWMMLITALHRSGRRADALDAYHRLRQRLAEELGIDPGDDVQKLYATVLAGSSASTDDGAAAKLFHVPRQLPGDVAAFTGRREHLEALDNLLAESRETATVGVIVGTAGIGKTALAVHWARRVVDSFPDGQLWVNLRGFDLGQAMTTGRALTRLLRAMGVPDAEIPLDPDEQSGLYRSLMDGRRLLLVLDNAATLEQVRPLLPGAPGCLVLVTSRSHMLGLGASENTRLVSLDLLSNAEAYQFLDKRLGVDRLKAEAAAADEIIASCARLPLALAILAARATAYPDLSLAALAAELRLVASNHGFLVDGGAKNEIYAAFSSSYRALSGKAAWVFRLLGLHPGPDIATAAVASTAAMTIAEVTPLLLELRDANLVTEHAPGRYTFHDLLKTYSAALAARHNSEASLHEARRRMFDHYLLNARAAALALPSFEMVMPVQSQQPTTILEHFGCHSVALSWLAREHHVLLAIVERAAQTGFSNHARRLAWTLTEYLFRQGHWHDWTRVLHIALDSTSSDEQIEQAQSHRGLARAYARLGRLESAIAHGRQALDLSTAAGDRLGLALSHRVFGVVLEAQGLQREALNHDLRALEIFKATGQLNRQARALNSIGWTYGQLGDHEQALEYCRQALRIQKELDDRHGQGTTWDSLGYLHHSLGDHRRAITCYLEALRITRELGGRYKEAETLARLGDIYDAAGDSAAAHEAWNSAVEILADLEQLHTSQLRTRLHNLSGRRDGRPVQPRQHDLPSASREAGGV